LFSDINISQGSVATYATNGGIFNNQLTANLPWSLPWKNFVNRLRFDRIVELSLWPCIFWPTRPVCLHSARGQNVIKAAVAADINA